MTKAKNRKHKTRIAKTLGVQTFPVGKTKEEQSASKRERVAADNRSPYHRTRPSAVLYVVLSPTLLTIIDPKKIEISCSDFFRWLDFLSSLNTEIVCRYYPTRFQAIEQNIALRR